MPHDDPHTHDHDHATIEADEPQGYYQHLAAATRSLLIEKGAFTADDMRAMIERIDERSPALGAKIVARAWTDQAFKARLLSRGKQTIKEEMEIDPVAADIVVVEKRPRSKRVGLHPVLLLPGFMLGGRRTVQELRLRQPACEHARRLREFGTEGDRAGKSASTKSSATCAISCCPCRGRPKAGRRRSWPW